ncbi:MAG TPA: gluconokinase [Candidatus Limosilactobacillus merdipullorum]|uniref:Gluconokinase n=1 Tax=Candidatus Limosilactobacillus merdipullorum TaxID=2838653 RepID=A0A9D1QQ34_9LACO|nr:gluconokinase [Candidatus Limosilactobacillus merdipullorum]
MSYYLGVDVGTTTTRAVVYDQHAHKIREASQTYPLYRQANGMAEQEPQQLVEAVINVINQVVDESSINTADLAAVGFSSSNQSIILLDEHYQPLTRLITWADTRAAKVAKRVQQSLTAQPLYSRTGTPVHPMSPLIKLMWLQEDHPELMKKTAYVAGVKSFLFHQLFGCFKVDISIASSTGLFNIAKTEWDSEALKMAGITTDQLPEVVSGTAQQQGLLPKMAAQLHIPADVPFVFGAYDGAMTNVGVGATAEDTVAITIGSSAGVRVITDHPVIDPEQRLFCYCLDEGKWVVGGPLNNGGAVFDWAVRHLVDTNAVRNSDGDQFDVANSVIAETPVGAHGLIFHPFLGGERAPLWDANARGSFSGLTPLHTRADMLRSVMEGITMNIATVFQVLCELVGRPKSVTATGGFSRSLVWRQMLADVLNTKVKVPQHFAAAALGAAGMAMKSTGLINDVADISHHDISIEEYQPKPEAVDIYQQVLPIFTQLEGFLAPSYQSLSSLQERLSHYER